MLSVTFDVDWAPDWAIALCADICGKAGVPATFFVTHQSDILTDLRSCPGIELGIHPNFLPNSSHGEAPAAVFDHMLGIIPAAKAMRSHALVQSSSILEHAERETTLESDVSLLLPFHPRLRPVRMHYDRNSRGLTRLPYFWEDDVCAVWPNWTWTNDPVPAHDGLQIYDFHPIHVALNIASLENYRLLKAHLAGRDLRKATPKDCAAFINPGDGARSFLQRLVKARPAVEFFSIAQITANAREATCA